MTSKVYPTEYMKQRCNPIYCWNITWSWFENNEKYAKEFAISENWWKASIAIEKIRLLQNFGRVEEQTADLQKENASSSTRA